MWVNCIKLPIYNVPINVAITAITSARCQISPESMVINCRLLVQLALYSAGLDLNRYWDAYTLEGKNAH
jgi:hypothetical protein